MGSPTELAFEASPEAFCKYTVKYIADPTTVRIRCRERFGRTLPVERIAAYRRAHEAQVAAFKRQAERRGIQE